MSRTADLTESLTAMAVWKTMLFLDASNHFAIATAGAALHPPSKTCAQMRAPLDARAHWPEAYRITPTAGDKA